MHNFMRCGVSMTTQRPFLLFCRRLPRACSLRQLLTSQLSHRFVSSTALRFSILPEILGVSLLSLSSVSTMDPYCQFSDNCYPFVPFDGRELRLSQAPPKTGVFFGGEFESTRRWYCILTEGPALLAGPVHSQHCICPLSKLGYQLA